MLAGAIPKDTPVPTPQEGGSAKEQIQAKKQIQANQIDKHGIRTLNGKKYFLNADNTLQLVDENL